MLVTDVGDEMRWWQVYDVDDRFKMLVTNSEKNRQHKLCYTIISVTIIKSPTQRCHKHFCHLSMSMTDIGGSFCWWRLWDVSDRSKCLHHKVTNVTLATFSKWWYDQLESNHDLKHFEIPYWIVKYLKLFLILVLCEDWPFHEHISQGIVLPPTVGIQKLKNWVSSLLQILVSGDSKLLISLVLGWNYRYGNI